MSKRTPLYHEHQQAEARLVEFAGYVLPMQYAGILAEHMAVREAVGIFDVSHMGEIECLGADATAMLQSLTPNDVTKLVDGKAQYSMFLNDRGGIIDDIIIYRLAADQYLIVVNAANLDTDWHWLMAHQQGDVVLKNRSDDYALIACQGPSAVKVLASLTDARVAALAPFHCTEAHIAAAHILIGRTGYTGEDGFELFCAPPDAPRIWRALREAGKPHGIQPCGLGARDTLRLEACYRLHGHDMNEQTTPFEAGLDWVVKLDKGEFLGRKALWQQREAGCKRRLVGFQMGDPGIPREGYPIIVNRKPIGYVTSGTMSPLRKIGIGLGYVPPALASIGTKFSVDIRGKERLAEAVATPFYTRQ